MNRESRVKKTGNQHTLHFAVITIILFLSFAFNFFGASSSGQFEGLQSGSDALVFNSLACSEGGSSLNTQFMVKNERGPEGAAVNGCPVEPAPYYSQVGLQGRVYTFIYSVFFSHIGVGLSTYALLVKLFIALSSAITLALFCFWVLKKGGILEAYLVMFMIANSIWLVNFAKSVYWVLPLMFLPFLLLIFTLNKEINNRNIVIIYSLLFAILCLRFATGYEYATTIIISLVAAVVLVSVLEKISFRRTAILILGVTLVGLAAMATVLAAHYLLIKQDVGSAVRAESILRERVFNRTSGGAAYQKEIYWGLNYTVPEIASIAGYYAPLDEWEKSPKIKTSIAVSVSNYLALPVVSSPIQMKALLENYILSFASFIVLYLCLSYNTISQWLRGHKVTKSQRLTLGLGLAALTGLIGIISWYLLARGHSFAHAHINGITLYLPFALLVYALIALKTAPYIRKFKMNLMKNA